MSKNLAFEEPVVQLREKIDELKTIAAEADVDMTGEIEKLETRLTQLEQSIYANMKPWDRVQVARHPERPTTLQYIEAMCENFIELHGDRTFGDDAAILGGIALLKDNLSLLLDINVVNQQKKIFVVILVCPIQKAIVKRCA